MILAGENRITRIKTCLSATLSTTNPTWIDPGANPVLQGERPATNRLSLCFLSDVSKWSVQGKHATQHPLLHVTPLWGRCLLHTSSFMPGSTRTRRPTGQASVAVNSVTEVISCRNGTLSDSGSGNQNRGGAVVRYQTAGDTTSTLKCKTKQTMWDFRFSRRCEVLRAFCDVAPCIGMNRRFRGSYCLHHNGDEISHSIRLRCLNEEVKARFGL
jgi:hypothetical protein